MSDYNPPLKDILFALDLAGLDDVLAHDAFADVDRDMIEQVVTEGGNFARDALAPLNVPGDRQGCRVVDKAVQVPDGFADAYAQFVANGWPAIAAPQEHGGMGLPDIVGLAGFELWNTANMAFALCPMLTGAAANAVRAHASESLKATYLEKLVSGEWSGTMVLTEPHAGSDLAAITTRATREGDHFRIFGTKIFITWGDHPMAENTVHLVLARIEDAPEGIRGISMFLVPKFLVNEDGSVGERNDAWVGSVEHKLGIHGSPTCVMNFGESAGAIGYLVGDENRGMANMFTMMNQARLEVGMQGLAVSERAYQLARSYALDRVQGVVPGHEGRVTIIKHADVRRNLLVMKSQIEAMRIAAYAMGAEIDRSHHAADAGDREHSSARVALLTPIIKGWLSETAQELTSIGVQIHGGMGFVEETGAAQHMRDARILPIYEGTTGIQAADLAGRKILGDEGRQARSLLAEMRATADALAAGGSGEAAAALSTAVDRLDTAVAWLIENAPADPDVPGAVSGNLLMLAGVVLGGWHMARTMLACAEESAWDTSFRDGKLTTAQFYLDHILPRSAGYAHAAMAGADTIMALKEEQF
jgi:acyl-CoA dehydrogenase